MSTITFDYDGNCLIKVPASSVKISFLTNPMFTNTAECLKSDIEKSQDDSLGAKLERFLKDLERGRFRFMDYDEGFQRDRKNCDNNECVYNSNDIAIVADDRINGDWMTNVHNVRAEHTGFWYAARNISREIQSIKERIHILSGYLLFADNISELIELIKSSESHEKAYNKLLKHGLTQCQAIAILEYRISMLAQLEKGWLTEEINNCNKLIEILKEYA